ncbi:MAG: class I SAM-dependent methyltransferase [Spirochaetia bacterium]|nr:class I SAM-dependent methyltransferase [Spirochaetia bacterium]
MKVRDSGMPDAAYWETLFDVPCILDRMRVDGRISSLVEVGCGHGTFTIPAAARISGTLYGFDIEPAMIEATALRAMNEALSNVEVALRDVITEGFGLADGSVDYVMLFNILHHDKPIELLLQSFRVLKSGGLVGSIHWNYDPNTPRGPTMDIRPHPEAMREWVSAAGFAVAGGMVDLPPHHYGWIGQKPP